jgi:pimeloyl-ACP methyl ester carboxylesterase
MPPVFGIVLLLAAVAFTALSPAETTAQDSLALAAASPVTTHDARLLHGPLDPLIVIGFMGGRIRAGDLVHRETTLARDLNLRYPTAVHTMMFANRDEPDALRSLLKLLNTGTDEQLNKTEKSAARIVLFGHSWGASEAVNFARELDRRGIPVLLTIQVDSVEKQGEDDGDIPANVNEAVNFYQAEGLLHGRRAIQAIDPRRTTILGNYESTYKRNPVSCAGYSWYARAFMKPHIEIENDSVVWNKIEALIVARSCAAGNKVNGCAA